MAYRHFLRETFVVRVGGVRIGPLRLGGHRYMVGPLSVLRAFQLWAALEGHMRTAPKIEDAVQAMAELPLDDIRPYLHLLILEKVRARDLRRLTQGQVMSVVIALFRANDIEYMVKAFEPSKEPQGTADGGDFLHAVVCASHGAYTHDEVKHLPFTQALGILECERNKANVAQGMLPGDEPMKMNGESYKLASMLQRAGIAVS